MSLLEALTDDQLALLGCGAAFAVAFGVMALTGAIRRPADERDTATPASRTTLTPAATEASSRRKAA